MSTSTIIRCPHCGTVHKEWKLKNTCTNCGKLFFAIGTQEEGTVTRKKLKVGRIKKWWWSLPRQQRNNYKRAALYIGTVLIIALFTVLGLLVADSNMKGMIPR